MRRPYLLTLLLGSLLFLTSCGEDEGFTIEPVPTAFVAFVNAIPDSPELSITNRGSTVARVQFGEASSVLTALPQLQIEYSADFLSDVGVVSSLLTTRETIGINDTRIIVFSGTMANPTVTSITSAASDLSSDTAQVLFLNASTKASNVDITLTDPAANTKTINLPVGVVSAPESVALGNGSQIIARDATSNELLWDSGLFNFTLVAERLIVMVDYFGPGDEVVRMFSITEQAGAGLFVDEQLESEIRFANMTADRGALDVLANDIVVASALNFSETTVYQDIATDFVNFKVTTSGDANDVLSNESRAILPGKSYTLGLSGLGISNGTALLVNDRRRVDARAVLNIIRLAPSSGLLDVYILEPGDGIGGFPIAQQLTDQTGLTIDLVPSSYDFALTAPAQDDALFGPEPITLNARGIYTLIITDTEGGGSPLRVQFLDDFIN